MLIYNCKEVIQMSKKKKKKQKKPRIDWKTLTATAILDFIIGFILLLIEHYLTK